MGTNFTQPLMIYEYMPPLQRKTCSRCMAPVREITMFATLPRNAHPNYSNGDATQVLPQTHTHKLGIIEHALDHVLVQMVSSIRMPF